MDQRIRIIVAASVMAGGLLLSLLFRHPVGQVELPDTLNSDPLVLQKPPPPGPTVVQPAERIGNRIGVPQPGMPSPSPAPTVVTPSNRPASPPELPKSYPGSGSQATSRWGISMGEILPAGGTLGGTHPAGSPGRETPAMHKVVDGDSLAVLAERYLGSAQRAMEIFQANRDVLNHPQILPIGVDLKIPPRDHSAARP